MDPNRKNYFCNDSVFLETNLFHTPLSPWGDLKEFIKKKSTDVWQKRWDNSSGLNELKLIEKRVTRYSSSVKLTRREETCLQRLRIGHSNLTHTYLMKKVNVPFCYLCLDPLTIKHIVEICTKYDQALVEQLFTHHSTAVELPRKHLQNNRLFLHQYIIHH